MTGLTIYQVDAFAEQPFCGNPAAIIPLQQWLPDTLMQSIAEENNLSETAFFVPHEDHYAIRWFTPAAEVDLCGHATLASAFVIFTEIKHPSNQVVFESKSGPLTVTLENDLLCLDFPSQPAQECEVEEALTLALGLKPSQCFRGTDLVAVFNSEAEITNLTPNFEQLKRIDTRGVIVTAPGDQKDFVCRFFTPQNGIDEDPVTGSAFTKLIPYWATQLGKNTLQARQVSQRGGDVFCELKGDRVLIAGKAVKYLEGAIEVNPTNR